MEELVKKIMNIEKQAAEKLEFEKKKYADPAADAEKIMVQKKIEAQAKAQERISAIAAEEEAEESDKIKELNDEFEQKKKELLAEFDKNKERLVNDILKRVTG